MKSENKSKTEINFRICKWCGMSFEPYANEKYCSMDCAERDYMYNYRERDIQQSEQCFANREMSKINRGVLDQRLAKAKEEGKTYAELQKELTLEKIRKGEL